MRLVVDANVLVSELLRKRGQTLVSDPRLELAMTERARDETNYETRKRLTALVDAGRISAERTAEVLALLDAALAATIAVIPPAIYAHLESAARRRIPRDPDDWPTVALALALDAGIWTHDADFLGCGVPTWTTETLLACLAEEQTPL